PDSNTVPPGDYLAFVVTADSVPNVAEWVRVKSGANPTAPSCVCTDGGDAPFFGGGSGGGGGDAMLMSGEDGIASPGSDDGGNTMLAPAGSGVSSDLYRLSQPLSASNDSYVLVAREG